MVQSQQQKYQALRQEIDESPASALALEIGQKNIAIAELQTKVKSANAVADEYKQKFEAIKREMVSLKK